MTLGIEALDGHRRGTRRLSTGWSPPRRTTPCRRPPGTAGTSAFSVTRLVDPDLAVGRSEARAAIARHRHDPVGRQRLGQLHVDRRVPARVGRDRADPEREHAEVLAHRVHGGVGAAAAAVGVPLRRDDAAGNDLLARVFGQDLQRLPARRRTTGRRACGRRSATGRRSPRPTASLRSPCRVPGGPSRRASRSRCSPAGTLPCSPRRRRSAACSCPRRPAARSPRRNDGLPGSRGSSSFVRLRSSGLRASLDEQHRHVDVRDGLFADRDVDRLLRRRQRELAVRAHALALGRHQRRRLLPRRLDHDRAPCRRACSCSARRRGRSGCGRSAATRCSRGPARRTTRA